MGPSMVSAALRELVDAAAIQAGDGELARDWALRPADLGIARTAQAALVPLDSPVRLAVVPLRRNASCH